MRRERSSVMTTNIEGFVRVDRRTKKLLTRIRAGEIALIDHEDLDIMAAEAFIRARVKAVINQACSITGKFTNTGPMALLQAGIPIIDCSGTDLFQVIHEGMRIRIEEEKILVNSTLVCLGERLRVEDIDEQLQYASQHVREALDAFIENTLQYAAVEKIYFLGEMQFPTLSVNMQDKHVLVVARGKAYREDLHAILAYIREKNPVLIAVDGGADALLELGIKPHVIVGDMDSVSDHALKSVKELVVHAYIDGRAPGFDRISRLGLSAHICKAPGTSEDVAMLLADEAGAALIVAVGTHTNMVDFYEKGRKGMASTLLTRLRIGRKLVDAKGVSQLYQTSVGIRPLLAVCIASLLPFSILAWSNPIARHIFHMLWLQIRLILT